MLRRRDQVDMAVHEPNRSLLLPDFSRLADFPTNGPGSSNGNGMANSTHQTGAGLSYENTDIQEITRRQLKEDIMAYRYDLDFCRSLIATDVTPQEARALQLRTLDLGHQIRSAQHRIELIEAQQRRGSIPAQPVTYNTASPATRGPQGRAIGMPAPVAGVKRQRTKRSNSDEDAEGESDQSLHLLNTLAASAMANGTNGTNGVHLPTAVEQLSPASTAVQRLGFWKCRLCTASKYLNAGLNRVPSEPSKWPLKDVSKMLNHFLDLHTEHTPAERCMELGAALAQNRGPFEYWLTQTRKQELEDLSILDGYVETLQAGRLPDGLRPLNRAAGLFPNNSHEKREK